MILAGEVQTFSMEAEDLQAVHHVEQDVRLLKLGHFLKKKKESKKDKPLRLSEHIQIKIIM